MQSKGFDIVVVGAGHAGVEACLVSARLGLSTVLITSSLDHISYMSCNPSIGGLGKGHMVRELDILGGQMAMAADDSCIQFKRLNSSRGAAVRGSRVQSDKVEYSKYMTNVVNGEPNLSLLAGEVAEVLLDGQKCIGVRLKDGSEIKSKAVVLTTGTFMNGVLHVGTTQTAGGRYGEKPSIGLSDQIRSLGFVVRRLKTGTPARLLKNSIDWSKTTPQDGDQKYIPFSVRSSGQLRLPQIQCFLSATNEKTHEIIRNNLDKSPMYCGQIEGTGPRYCPSIEDKITRFADKTEHQTFLEPEGINSELIYLQGISTSLPPEIQLEFLRTIRGLESVEVARYGYAVEYDYFEPHQVQHTLETRSIESLYFAGQINGTSGYEEAAVQGFVAGTNAALKLLDREPLILTRSESYIGVLVDDLVTKGTKEPYRMFTSRAEHRLVLREDNAVERLASVSRRLGILPQSSVEAMQKSLDCRAELHAELARSITPKKETLEILAALNSKPLLKSTTLKELLRRPEINVEMLSPWIDLIRFSELDREAVEIHAKYEGYIRRQVDLINASKSLESLVLPGDLDFHSIYGLSREEREKLSLVRPRTLGQASRVSGVNPSALQAIMIYIKGNSRKSKYGKAGKLEMERV